MSRIVLVLSLLLVGVVFSQEVVVDGRGDSIILREDGTWQKKEVLSVDSNLLGCVKIYGIMFGASKEDVLQVYVLALAGWKYTSPQPKSAQASWGNFDRRTTWWYGYWYNRKTNQYSSGQPIEKYPGVVVGDGQNFAGMYRNGGSPYGETKVESMMSELSCKGG